jgi:hypothetical protein
MSTTEQPGTPFSYKCAILGDFVYHYGNRSAYSAFILDHSFALQIAWGIDRELVQPVEGDSVEVVLTTIIDEAWTAFLESFGITEDKGFKNLEQLWRESPNEYLADE